MMHDYCYRIHTKATLSYRFADRTPIYEALASEIIIMLRPERQLCCRNQPIHPGISSLNQEPLVFALVLQGCKIIITHLTADSTFQLVHMISFPCSLTIIIGLTSQQSHAQVAVSLELRSRASNYKNIYRVELSIKRKYKS